MATERGRLGLLQGPDPDSLSNTRRVSPKHLHIQAMLTASSGLYSNICVVMITLKEEVVYLRMSRGSTGKIRKGEVGLNTTLKYKILKSVKLNKKVYVEVI